MNLRSLAIIAALLAPALWSSGAQARWGGPGYADTGYYNVGPVYSGATAGFSFGGAMRGRGYGHGLHHFNRHLHPRPYTALRPVTPSWIIRGVNFKYDSAELTPPSLLILDSVAATLRDRPSQPLEVGGHASAEGTGPYNMALSNRRAQTVRAYLVKRGVNPDMLTYRGYGETRPLVPNVTDAGRRFNRRVELMPIFQAQR